jgi:hypothetical protein
MQQFRHLRKSRSIDLPVDFMPAVAQLQVFFTSPSSGSFARSLVRSHVRYNSQSSSVFCHVSKAVARSSGHALLVNIAHFQSFEVYHCFSNHAPPLGVGTGRAHAPDNHPENYTENGDIHLIRPKLQLISL